MTPRVPVSGRRPAVRRRDALVVAATGLLLLAGCAGRAGGAGVPAPPPDPEPAPAALLDSALAALDSAGHAPADELLAEARRRCGPSPVGGRATLMLAALRLDPRNPDAAPQEAADLAAEYLRTGAGPAWTEPLARVLYLEALDTGASPPDPAGLASGPAASEGPRPAPDACGEPGEAGAMAPSRTLPSLPGAARAVRLERLRRRVAALQEELDRIRRILDEP